MLMFFKLFECFLNELLDIALVKNNARVGAEIAVALSHLRENCNKGKVMVYSFVGQYVKVRLC